MPEPSDTSTPVPAITEVEPRSVLAVDSAPPPVAERSNAQPVAVMKPDQLVPFTDEELQKATAQNAIALARNVMWIFYAFKKSPTATGTGFAAALAIIARDAWPQITGAPLPENIARWLRWGGAGVAIVLGAMAIFKTKTEPLALPAIAPPSPSTNTQSS